MEDQERAEADFRDHVHTPGASSSKELTPTSWTSAWGPAGRWSFRGRQGPTSPAQAHGALQTPVPICIPQVRPQPPCAQV